jgi:hypothetical protein
MRPKFLYVALFSCSCCLVSAAAETVAGTTSVPAKGQAAFKMAGQRGLPVQAPTSKNEPTGFKKLDGAVADGALWFSYFRAGEDAQLKNNESWAKRYWLQSLSEIEKVNSHATDDLDELVKISALEQALTNAYPKDWSNLQMPKDDAMNLRREQMSTLYRIARLNDRWVPKGNLLLTKSRERYMIARRDYEKAVADNKNSTAQ